MQTRKAGHAATLLASGRCPVDNRLNMNAGNRESVAELIALAKREDLGSADVSSALLPDRFAAGQFRLVAREEGVFAGREIGPAVLAAYDPNIECLWTDCAHDGERLIRPPVILAAICGPIGAVLSAERVLLNFFQRLCGVATLTRRFVDAVATSNAAIYDTRKTTPGWRVLEKYAVRCGGGRNHRQGLFDAVLIKDNHLAGVTPDRLAARVFEMVNTLHHIGARPAFIEVEADDLLQFEALLDVEGIDVILLDNFSLADLRRAVEMRDGRGLAGKLALEASGGITLDNVAAVAASGVERISVGAITHSAVAVDLSLERL